MRALLLAPTFLLLASAACAQPSRTLADDDWCEDTRYYDDRARVCEVRESMVRADVLDIEVMNGAVTVREWDRPDVLVRARVQAWAGDESRARQLIAATTVTTAGGRVRTERPDTRNEGVSVSYEVYAPPATDVTLAAMNGPVHIEGLRGKIRATAMNGPVCLIGLGGDVEVVATNGPVSVDLSGDAWHGSGLAVRATNGPITLDLPARYSARLKAHTEQGSINAPGMQTTRSRRWGGHRLDTTLGNGGALLTLDAHNGPVRIRPVD